MSSSARKMEITGATDFLNGYLSEPSAQVSSESIVEVPIKTIYRPKQQRVFFDRAEIEKLKTAIQSEGFRGTVLLTPLLSDHQERRNGYKYELVYGASRTLACEELGHKNIRAEIQELTSQQVRRLRFDENMVRKNLNPFEEISGYLELMADEAEVQLGTVEHDLNAMSNSAKRGGGTTPQVEERLQTYQKVLSRYSGGKLTTFRTKLIKFRSLPGDVDKALAEGKIEASKALELGSVKDKDARQEILDWVIQNNPTVADIRKEKRLRLQATEEKPVSKGRKTANIKRASKAAHRLSRLMESGVLEKKNTEISSLLEQINELIDKIEKTQ